MQIVSLPPERFRRRPCLQRMTPQIQRSEIKQAIRILYFTSVPLWQAQGQRPGSITALPTTYKFNFNNAYLCLQVGKLAHNRGKNVWAPESCRLPEDVGGNSYRAAGRGGTCVAGKRSSSTVRDLRLTGGHEPQKSPALEEHCLLECGTMCPARSLPTFTALLAYCLSLG
jgi:hypothetical protein